MKKILLSLALLFGFTLSSFAQNYDSAVGLRLGSPLAISYKKFISESDAIEAYGGLIFNTFYSEISANAAYLIHTPIESVDALNWYWGFGGGISFFSYNTTFTGNRGGATIRGSGYIGLDYSFSEIPLNLSIDAIPTIGIGGGGSGFGIGGAIAARYILNGN